MPRWNSSPLRCWRFNNAHRIRHFTIAQPARKFHAAALERGLLLRPLGNTVYFMPPYVIEEEQMNMLVDGTCGILDSLA